MPAKSWGREAQRANFQLSLWLPLRECRRKWGSPEGKRKKKGRRKKIIQYACMGWGGKTEFWHACTEILDKKERGRETTVSEEVRKKGCVRERESERERERERSQ
jgi:undecaprenyl pyrophosphate synthase